MNRRRFLAVTTMLASETVHLTAQKRKQPWPCPECPEPDQQTPVSSRGRQIAKIGRSIQIFRDIPYLKRPERILRLNVYFPRGEIKKPLPAILRFGVGSWTEQDKDFRIDLDALPLAPTPDLYAPVMVPQGFVVVSAECRVARDAKFPAQIYDCKCAVKWMRSHGKEFHIDPSRIGIMGASSSGHLAALVAVTSPEDGLEDDTCYPGYSSIYPIRKGTLNDSSPEPLASPNALTSQEHTSDDVSSHAAYSDRVQAAYCFAGLFDFEYYQSVPGDGTLQPQINEFLGGTYQQIPEVYRQASPARYITPDDPPFLLMHGIQDRRVPYEQTLRFVELLKKAGVPVRFLPINNYLHGPMAGKEPDPSVAVMDQEIYGFFHKYLGTPNRK